MPLSRIDLIAQNGGDGSHYKYQEAAETILKTLFGENYLNTSVAKQDTVDVIKTLIEYFPDDNS